MADRIKRRMVQRRADLCKKEVTFFRLRPIILRRSFSLMNRIALLLTMALFGHHASAEPLSVSAKAPDVTATNQNGQPVDFAKIYEKGLTLVYFYPKADTPGCTAQACSLRDSFATLSGEGLTVLGVSKDSVEAQKKFQEKYKIPFDLIADSDGTVAKAFGVETIPIVGMTKRQSFIVKDGKIAWTSLSAKTGEAAQEVQTALDKLR